MRASSANQTSIRSAATPFSRAISSRCAGKLFKILDRSLGLSVVTRPRRQLAIAHAPQLPAQGLLGHRDPELLKEPLAQIDQTPPHDAVNRRHRPALDHRRERRPVRVVEPRGLPGRLPVDETIGPVGVELHHPVPHDLQRHTANRRRLRARRSVIDRRQRQKTPRLRPVLRPPRKPA